MVTVELFCTLRAELTPKNEASKRLEEYPCLTTLQSVSVTVHSLMSKASVSLSVAVKVRSETEVSSELPLYSVVATRAVNR